MSEARIMDNIKESLTKGTILTPYVLTAYINLISDKDNLKNLISTIEYFNKGKNVLGTYNNSNQNLYINYMHYILNTENSNRFKNLNLLETCFHELTHSCQKELLMDTKDSRYFRTLTSFYVNMADCMILMNIDYDFYNEHHDEFIFEYQAIMMAKFKLLQLLRQLNLDDLSITVNKSIARKIMTFYEGDSPLKKSLDMIEEYGDLHRPYIELDKNFDEYTKLICGYPIKNDTMEVMENIANAKVKTLDIRNHLN